MKTDHRGTTLQSLAEAAKKHGFAAKGLRLTFAGLLKVASGNGVQVFGSSGVQGAKGKRRGDSAIAGRFLPPHSHTPIRPYLIALIRPGHFVLVERLNFAEVQVWDPSGAGRGEAARRRMTREEWEQTWDGVALVVSPAALGSGGTGDGG
jgi:ABC-type bacteriocin/lantibiotic exporter with double-glycine peptidase domain